MGVLLPVSHNLAQPSSSHPPVWPAFRRALSRQEASGDDRICQFHTGTL